jgi:hypothetical protein
MIRGNGWKWLRLCAGWVVGLFMAEAMWAGAADATVVTHDTLAYKDGDRVQGHFVGREGNLIVFKSDRFGELRVLATDAVVIPAEKPAVAVKPAAPPVTAPANASAAAKPAATVAETKKKEKAAADEKEEEERVSLWEKFSPMVLTAKVRKFFGPWHGRLALSAEVVSDTTDRNNIAADATLRRKWEKDEVQMNGRFDYSETNKLATTDVVKGSGLWRHDFDKKFFAQYRPTAEWNRASTLGGLPNDYVLLQQEIGVGYNIINTPARKLRSGVSENLFDVWNTSPTHSHTSRGVQSAFEEVEWTLPWRMALTQRGVWYPVPGQPDGWENRIELNKKLTETLSTSLRHEIRRNNPDGSAQDYTRLKLLFGFDF